MKWSRTRLLLLGLALMLVGCSQETKKADLATKVSNQPIEIAVSGQAVGSNTIEAIVRLRNPNDQNVKIAYPSSQRFELMVRDGRNHVIYTFSKEHLFTQAIEEEQFKPYEEKEYEVTIELSDTSDAKEIDGMTVQQFEGARDSTSKVTSVISKEKL